MNRTPPQEVRRRLRKEVGFGCPVPGCSSPYLYWHHFDPPFHEREHHDPKGMIALCGEHHAKADVGSYTKEQLRGFKVEAALRVHQVAGRFEWMRRNLLGIVGGNFYYETQVIVEYQNQPVIWFNRDEDGYLLLNIRMLSVSKEPRVIMEDNFWLSRGDPVDLECPPSGKLLGVSYSNGDALKVEFFALDSIPDLKCRYPECEPIDWNVPFPITAVEVHERVGGTNIEFGPQMTTVGGLFMFGNFFSGLRVGLSIDSERPKR